MSRAQASVGAPLLSSNSLHMTVGEAQYLHLFEYLNDRNVLVQILDECNVITLSRAEV